MIECPKCAAPCPDAAVECPRCGIVFAKFVQRPAEADPVVLPPNAKMPAETPVEMVSDPLRGVTRLARAAVLVGLIVWTWQFARAPMGVAVSQSILHGPNLIFHEAGHVLFCCSDGS